MDYSDPLSDEELRSFDVLSMDSTCVEEPKTIEMLKKEKLIYSQQNRFEMHLIAIHICGDENSMSC